MSLDISPPLSYETSVAFVQRVQVLWNNGEPEDVIGLFAADCEWRDNERQLSSKTEISNYLHQCQKTQLHYSVRAELWSHSFFRLAISFQSEWQNPKRGHWFRSSGHLFVRLDNIGKIKEFCLSTSENEISVNQRRIGINSLDKK